MIATTLTEQAKRKSTVRILRSPHGTSPDAGVVLRTPGHVTPSPEEVLTTKGSLLLAGPDRFLHAAMTLT